MMPLSQIRWGTGNENILYLGWPLDNTVPRRKWREGSKLDRFPSGAQDAIVTGRDFTVTGEIGWIPEYIPADYSASSWSGPAGVQAFLDWCEDGNTFRLVFDALYPDFWMDGCVLRDPASAEPRPESDGTLRLSVTIAHPTADLALHLRGLMIEFEPQGDYTRLSPAPAFSRASVARFQASDLSVVAAASGALRDRHYPVAGVKTALIEPASANGWSHPEELNDVVWTKTGATVSSNAATAPDGAVTMDALIESAANVLHGFSRATPALTNNTKSTVSLFARPTGRSWFRIATTDKSNTVRNTFFNATAGLVGTKDSGHTVTIVASITSDGVRAYRVSVTFDSAAGATPPTVEVLLATADGGGAYLGDGVSGMCFWGMTFEVDQPMVSSYMGTTARNVDVLPLPLPTAALKPQAGWFYVKFVELGTVLDGTTSGLWGIGDSANAALFVLNNGGLYSLMHRRAADAAVTLAVAPVYGDTVELFAQLFADGSVQLHQSINGGAVTSTAVSAANTLAATWNTSTLRLGDRGAGTTGRAGFVKLRGGYRTTVNTMALARAA